MSSPSKRRPPPKSAKRRPSPKSAKRPPSPKSAAARSAIGGAANTAGESFRSRVAARIAVYLLTQQALAPIAAAAVPTRLRLESTAEVDDIEVETTAGGRAWIQAKRSLDLSARPASPLGKAAAQLVRQFLREPSLDPSRDRLVIVYATGSRKIGCLSRVLRRFRHDGSLSRKQACVDNAERQAFDAFERLILAAWQAEDRGDRGADWIERRRLYSMIELWIVPEGPGGSVDVDPEGLLGRVLEDPLQAVLVADVLSAFMTTLAKDHRSVDRAGLCDALSEREVRLVLAEEVAGSRTRYLDGIQTQWRNHRPLGVLADHTVWASDVRSQDVFVSPCLRAGPNPEDAELRVDTLVARLRQRRLVAVLGDVGSGKSTLRLWCAHELAVDAGGVDAGIPVLLHARALQHRTSLRLVDLLPDEARVFERSRARWYLLVDGIDEVGGSIWPYLAELRRTNPSILGILATSRPSTPPDPALGFETLRIEPWSAADRESFLGKWDRSAPSAVQQIRAQLETGAGAELLQNPLSATAALLIASEGQTLCGRAAIFAATSELLFGHWRSSRPSCPLSWDVVRPALLELALESLRGGTLTAERIRRVFAARGTAAHMELQHETERHLGVLVRNGETYEFILRAVPEYLVGEALARGPVGGETFESVARTTWGHEVIRHALGLAAQRGDPSAYEPRLRFLAELAPAALCDPSALRAFTASLDASVDLSLQRAEVSPETQEVVARGAASLLLDETSIWIGDVVAEHVRRLARAGDDVWCRVLRILLDRVGASEADPAAWYTGAGLTVEDWRLALLHREPSVRSIAVDRLAEHLDREDVRAALWTMIFDEAHDFENAPPAVRAALAWRRVPRQPGTANQIAFLRRVVGGAGQLTAGAAALALLPGEAPVAQLARALMSLSEAIRLPRSIVEDLRAAPGGAAALAAEWPRWTERVDAEVHRRCYDAPLEDLVTPPPSRQVRHRIVTACGPGLASLSDEALGQLGALVPSTVAAELIRSGHPDRAMGLRLHDIPLQHQRDLGELLIGSDAARGRLIDAWRECTHGGLYPGIALEPLIELGGDEAARAAQVYAAWLGSSPYAWGIYSYAAREAVIRNPIILPAARTLAGEVIRRVIVRAPDGTRLAPTSAGRVLRNIASAWLDDEAILEGVWSLLADGMPDSLRAVLMATHNLELSEQRLEDLSGRVQRALQAACSAGGGPDDWDLSRVELEIDWVDQRHLVERAAPVLRELASCDDEIGWRAGAVLWPVLTAEERRDLAMQIAREAVEAAFVSMPEEYLRRFVQAAPESWAAAICVVIEAGRFRAETLGVDALRLLPRGLQLDVCAHLRQSGMAGLELPWRNSGQIGECARTADTVCRILYEIGDR